MAIEKSFPALFALVTTKTCLILSRSLEYFPA